jgi:hypothetical protein
LKVIAELVVPDTGSLAVIEKEWTAGVPRLACSTFSFPEVMLNAEGRVLDPFTSTDKSK